MEVPEEEDAEPPDEGNEILSWTARGQDPNYKIEYRMPEQAEIEVQLACDLGRPDISEYIEYDPFDEDLTKFLRNGYSVLSRAFDDSYDM